MRRAAKRDDSEPDIILALQEHGWKVTQLSGRDVADLLCSKRGIWLVLECKSEGGKLKIGQAEWIREQNAPVGVVKNRAEALAFARWAEWEYGRPVARQAGG